VEGCPIVIPRTLLIAAGAFDGLAAETVGSAVARGVGAGGWPADVCPIVPDGERPSDARSLLDALDFDARMRRARAVVLAEQVLRQPALATSPAFEIATRARQAGVPAYAITAHNLLDLFDARMLDLQLILEASSTRALTQAGRRLAELV
jgi:glycerate kinase